MQQNSKLLLTLILAPRCIYCRPLLYICRGPGGGGGGGGGSTCIGAMYVGAKEREKE